MPTQIATRRGQYRTDHDQSKKLGVSLHFGAYKNERPDQGKGENHGNSDGMDGFGALKDFPLPFDKDYSQKSVLVGKIRVLWLIHTFVWFRPVEYPANNESDWEKYIEKSNGKADFRDRVSYLLIHDNLKVLTNYNT